MIGGAAMEGCAIVIGRNSPDHGDETLVVLSVGFFEDLTRPPLRFLPGLPLFLFLLLLQLLSLVSGFALLVLAVSFLGLVRVIIVILSVLGRCSGAWVLFIIRTLGLITFLLLWALGKVAALVQVDASEPATVLSATFRDDS